MTHEGMKILVAVFLTAAAMYLIYVLEVAMGWW